MSLITDASNTHDGATLQQKESCSWRPLAFFSSKLSATQQRYSTFDRELLGVFLPLCHFCFELEGLKFHVLTDHLPLVSALLRVSPPWSARQQRQLSYISEFTSDLRLTPGAANVVADNLSRPPPASPPAPQLPPYPGIKVSEVWAVLEVPEVSVSPIPSPFTTSSVINFSELAKEQLPCPDILYLKASPAFQSRTVLFSVTQGLKFSAPLFHLRKSSTFSPPYMECHILEFVYPDLLFLQDLSGRALPMMSVTGANPAYCANEERSSTMFTFAQKKFLFPSEDLHMYMSTLLVPCLLLMVLHISSPASTDQQDGLKLFL